MLTRLRQLSLDFFSAVAADSTVLQKGASTTPSQAQTPQPLATIRPTAAQNRRQLTNFTHPKANRMAQLDGHEIAYHFRRAKRRSIGFSVSGDGLTVSAPRWTLIGEMESALQEKSAWVLQKLQHMQQREEKNQGHAVDWRDGAELLYLGQKMRVTLTEEVKAPIDGDTSTVLCVPLPASATPSQIRDWVQAWLMRQATQLFESRLHHFAPQLGVRWRKFSLSSANTRWGSASSDGGIRLNWRLIHHPLPIIDYVVAHELSHLRVMNHSPDFWDTVASVLPDYRDRRSALKNEAIPNW
jgi:predicted metal-dependent hydrolase